VAIIAGSCRGIGVLDEVVPSPNGSADSSSAAGVASASRGTGVAALSSSLQLLYVLPLESSGFLGLARKGLHSLPSAGSIGCACGMPSAFGRSVGLCGERDASIVSRGADTRWCSSASRGSGEVANR
jgi:hypothetical protein